MMLLALSISPWASLCPEDACLGVVPTWSECPSAPSAARSLAPPDDGKPPHRLFWRNEATHPAEVLKVSPGGFEETHGFIGPGVRRSVQTLQNDVWRVRAVRPGQPGDRRLMVEHTVGAVPVRNCDCPQPAFVDCNKPPFKGPRWTINDPVIFDNQGGEPLDVFYWNGTCEELISWREIGGVQPMAAKYIQSTMGHTFRLRSASTQRMLMQHTLKDVVVRGCDEPAEEGNAESLDALRAATAALSAEHDALREQLAGRLSLIAAALSRAMPLRRVSSTRSALHVWQLDGWSCVAAL